MVWAAWGLRAWLYGSFVFCRGIIHVDRSGDGPRSRRAEQYRRRVLRPFSNGSPANCIEYRMVSVYRDGEESNAVRALFLFSFSVGFFSFLFFLFPSFFFLFLGGRLTAPHDASGTHTFPRRYREGLGIVRRISTWGSSASALVVKTSGNIFFMWSHPRPCQLDWGLPDRSPKCRTTFWTARHRRPLITRPRRKKRADRPVPANKCKGQMGRQATDLAPGGRRFESTPHPPGCLTDATNFDGQPFWGAYPARSHGASTWIDQRQRRGCFCTRLVQAARGKSGFLDNKAQLAPQ